MTFTAANSTEDLGPIVLAVTVTTSLLALIAVILRFIARRALRAPLWWDDWLILPTPILGFGGIIVASLCKFYQNLKYS